MEVNSNPPILQRKKVDLEEGQELTMLRTELGLKTQFDSEEEAHVTCRRVSVLRKWAQLLRHCTQHPALGECSHVPSYLL